MAAKLKLCCNKRSPYQGQKAIVVTEKETVFLFFWFFPKPIPFSSGDLKESPCDVWTTCHEKGQSFHLVLFEKGHLSHQKCLLITFFQA